MKKLLIIGLLANFSIAYAQDEGAINSKIDELSKQKVAVEAEIAKYKAMLPVPVKPDWTYKGNVAVNFGQSLLGNDYSSAYGGNSNLNFQAIAHLEANYAKGRHSWSNGFDGKMGFVKNFDDNNTGVNTSLAKNADMLQLSSKYLYDLQTSNLKAGLAVNFFSQFTKTYDLANNNFLISDFLAPGILDISPGLEWSPAPYFKVYFAPAMGRFTFVINDTIITRATENRFGNDVDSKVRSEFGAKADILFEKEIVKNLVVRSRAQLFNNWSRAQTQLDAINSSRTNIDLNWQNDIFYKVTKNIALNFGVQMLYDDDVRVKNNTTGGFNNAQMQWRQNFGVGMVYGF